jgi:hypothetical protein
MAHFSGSSAFLSPNRSQTASVSDSRGGRQELKWRDDYAFGLYAECESGTKSNGELSHFAKKMGASSALQCNKKHENPVRWCKKGDENNNGLSFKTTEL